MPDNKILLKKPPWRNQLNAKLVVSMKLFTMSLPPSHEHLVPPHTLAFYLSPCCAFYAMHWGKKATWNCNECVKCRHSCPPPGWRFDRGADIHPPVRVPNFFPGLQIFVPEVSNPNKAFLNDFNVYWIFVPYPAHPYLFLAMLQPRCARSWKPPKAHQSSRPRRFQRLAGSTLFVWSPQVRLHKSI